MAYTPINWQTGDTITAEKLNKCDNGWSVETTSTTVYSGSVTYSSDVELGLTKTELSYTIGNEATITWNGTEYNCVCFNDDGCKTYGAPYGDFSTYPFCIYLEGSSWYLSASTAGTYTLVISTSAETVEVSDDFVKAVDAVPVSNGVFWLVKGTTTYDEYWSAVSRGNLIIFKIPELKIVTSVSSNTVYFFPEDDTLSASFVDGVFTWSFS